MQIITTFTVVRLYSTMKPFALGMLTLWMLGCSSPKEGDETGTYADVHSVGAMRSVMRNGELGGRIDLDTLTDRRGLYGLGPLSYLRGEVLINDGNCYVSTVTTDSSMKVELRYDVSAPFFVYARVKEWTATEVPDSVHSLQDLEAFIDRSTADAKRPFAFKLSGRVTSATIHVQNLPEGTPVSSPEEAHQGQVNYGLAQEAVQIIGFFSTEHRGVFTHHDSDVHMHLITADKSKMGHLDELEIADLQLFLPKE